MPSPIIVTAFTYLHLLVLSAFHHILFVFMASPLYMLALCHFVITLGTVSNFWSTLRKHDMMVGY